jgi:3-deoxy-D-manno-octulosonic-acid transferase
LGTPKISRYQAILDLTGCWKFARMPKNCKLSSLSLTIENHPKKSWWQVAPGPKTKSIPYFNAHPELKLIIAPHQIHEDHLLAIESQLERPFQRYSMTTPEKAASCDCLIIDCFGLLSSIYRYGDISYIGGGFGSGIHNTLEAAVYGIPVLFGPNHRKFQEAFDLLKCKGGICIDSKETVYSTLDKLLNDEETRLNRGIKAGEMVQKGSGGTIKILNTIHL